MVPTKMTGREQESNVSSIITHKLTDYQLENDLFMQMNIFMDRNGPYFSCSLFRFSLFRSFVSLQRKFGVIALYS